MPIQYYFDKDINCVVGQYIETITKDEIIQALHDVYESEQHNKATTELWDFIRCRKLNISSLDFVEIANCRKSLHYFESNIKIAVVSQNADLSVFFYEYVTLLKDLNLTFKSFSRIEKALEWLKN